MKKHALKILIVLAMFFALTPVYAMAAENDITDSGLAITTGNINDMTGSYTTADGGSVTVDYDTDNETVKITMNNAKLTGGINVTGINTNLVLTGANSITRSVPAGTPTNDDDAVRVDDADLQINGSGSLQAKGALFGIAAVGNLTITNATVNAESLKGGFPGSSAAIQAWGDILIDNSTITATAQNAAAEYGCYGIYVQGDKSITIRNNSNVTVLSDDIAVYTGKTLTVNHSTLNATSTNSAALFAINGVVIENASNVTAKAQFTAIQSGHEADGEVFVAQDIIIDNSTVQADSAYSNGFYSTRDIIIRNKADVKGTCYYPVLYAYGDINIDGSKLNAESDDAGIFSRQNISITNGSDVTAKGYYPGINTWENINIDNSVVNAESTGDVGIYATDITISGENANVTAKSDAADYFDDSTGNTYSFPAICTDGYVAISGGTVSATATEGCGILSFDNIQISGGQVNIKSEEGDGISAPAMTLSGGVVSIECGSNAKPIILTDDNALQYTGGVLQLPNATADETITINNKEYYSVIFDAQNNTEITSVLVEKGQTLAAPAEPKKANATFDGWHTDAAADSEWDFASAVNNHLTLYAHWQQTASSGSHSSSSSSAKPDVSVEGGRGGAVTANSSGVVTITPDAGYQTAKITVNGKEVEIPADGKLSGLKSTDKVVVLFEKISSPAVNPFTDVNADAWYYDSVIYVVEKGLFQGTTDTTFSPNDAMTRGMLATVMYRLAGSPDIAEENPATTFTDVEPTAYYAAAIRWAQQNDIVKGYSDEIFAPNDLITREQLAAVLYRYAENPAPPNLLLSFNDADSISEYAEDALRWAVDKKIIVGNENNLLNPTGNAARAEVAAMLMRFANEQ